MKKIIFALIAMFCVTAASAQRARANDYEQGDNDSHFAIAFGVGSIPGVFLDTNNGRTLIFNGTAFDIDLRWQKNINNYFALDALTLNYAAPFDGPAYYDEISARTGVRGFTPKFYKNMCGYANIDLGYTCVLEKDIYSDEMVSFHSFGLEFGAGFELTKHIAIGYSLHYNTAVQTTSHFGKISCRF